MSSQLIDIQRRFVEIGRLRTGERVATTGGKSRPKKLDTWRLTSPSKDAIVAAAEKYGGSPEAWEDQYQVVTESATLEVMLPPQAGVRSYSLSYELWSGGGCQRRCNGQDAMIARGDQLVPMACQCDPDDRECKPTLRVPFFLPDLPGLGVWRLDTGGYNAAAELPGMLDLLAQFTAVGKPVRAILRLEQRTSKKAGKTQKFAVPVLDLPYSLAELTGGELAQLPSNGTAAPQLTSSPHPVAGEAPAVPESPPPAPQPAAVAADDDDRPDRPPRPVMPLDAPLTGDELQRWRAGTHAGMRARIEAAADEHQALRDLAAKLLDLGDRSLNDLTLREWQTLAVALREMPTIQPDASTGTEASAAAAVSSSELGQPAAATPAPEADSPQPSASADNENEDGSEAVPWADDDGEPAPWEAALYETARSHGIVGWPAIDDVARKVFPGREPDDLDESDWQTVGAEIAAGVTA